MPQREPTDSEFKIKEHPQAVVERYRKIRERYRRCEGNEKAVAKKLLVKMREEFPHIQFQVKAQDHREAVQKANETVARAAAARAAAMENGNSPLTATDQAAYWAGFIEETIAYIADHPNEPAPSAVVFVEGLDLGEEGRIFTSIKKMGALTLARWADSKIAEQVEELRTMQRDLERGKLPRAVQRAVDKVRGKSKRAKKKRSPKPSRKRKKAMAEALLERIDDECDVSCSESEDKDSGEELFEFELIVPKSLWPKIMEDPEVLVKYMDGLANGDDVEEDEDEPSDSGMGLDPDDPFPNDDEEEPEDFDEDEDDE